MPRPRKALIAIEDTPYYHVVSRCVRRSFLCGIDTDTGKSFEHRRTWIEQRIRLLASLFAIDICAYAVMSNHLHIVVKLHPQEAKDWSTQDVLLRWTSLHKGTLLVQRYLAGGALSAAELDTVHSCIDVYRQRLTSLSWFMKCLNEPIARQANQEDGCSGHFWEARFKSQALLTEEALLSCMAYVDLNPIRANIAETPEGSDYTSIKERLTPTFDLAHTITEQTRQGNLHHFGHPLKPLLHFEGALVDQQQHGIQFSLHDYLQLVDYTGRTIRPEKRGAIKRQLPPILRRLNLSQQDLLIRATQFEARYTTLFSRRAHRDTA
ncbi:transposase [Arsukibacterium sp.]|uniref:transposase n=1 Tax=Arsukibacterium sp. TaxID=1977258 RepID=UPI001BD668E2|nr:transposase [Arsukibacterium sp.]